MTYVIYSKHIYQEYRALLSYNMTRRPDTTFDRALDRFRGSLTEEQKRDFSSTTLEDVKLEIQKIQHRFGQEKKLRNLRRISKFLEAMKQVEQVVTIFLNVHEVVAFIWVNPHLLQAAVLSGMAVF
jgi:hypothetical protein